MAKSIYDRQERITDDFGGTLMLDWTTDGTKILFNANGQMFNCHLEMPAEEAERFAKNLKMVLRECKRLRRH